MPATSAERLAKIASLHDMAPDSTESLRNWWRGVSSDLPADVRGLWFGLADLVSDGGRVERTLYVAGATTFDADDGGDWAVDPAWMPQERYVVVDEIAELPVDDWRGAEQMLVELIEGLAPQSASPAIKGVAVGFDGGDAIVVWETAP